MSLQVVVEGDTDVPVVNKLAADAGLEVARLIDMGGKSQLDLRFAGFNKAARGSPWLVLRDLDQDAKCPPDLLKQQAVRPEAWMVYRIASGRRSGHGEIPPCPSQCDPREARRRT